MKQPKFNIGDVLYHNHNKRIAGTVQEIVIRTDVIYYVFGHSCERYSEFILTDKAPCVDVKMDMADIEILHQFFGDMNLIEYDTIVGDQPGIKDISSKAVGDLPFRMYVLLDNFLKQK